MSVHSVHVCVCVYLSGQDYVMEFHEGRILSVLVWEFSNLQWSTWVGTVKKRQQIFDMYMSYRWHESFNTVRSPSDSWRHHNGDWHVWAQNAERRGDGGWTIHPSRRWLISCARAMVLYVCLSIALTSCITSMAETNLDAIRKQKNAEYSKRYRLKRKMKMQQQAPTTPEAEPEKLQV